MFKTNAVWERHNSRWPTLVDIKPIFRPMQQRHQASHKLKSNWTGQVTIGMLDVTTECFLDLLIEFVKAQ